MRLPKSRALRISLAVLLALVAVPVLAMAYFQTLEPPSGVRSAAELRVPTPSARPALMGAGVQLDNFVQGSVSDAQA